MARGLPPSGRRSCCDRAARLSRRLRGGARACSLGVSNSVNDDSRGDFLVVPKSRPPGARYSAAVQRIGSKRGRDEIASPGASNPRIRVRHASSSRRMRQLRARCARGPCGVVSSSTHEQSIGGAMSIVQGRTTENFGPLREVLEQHLSERGPWCRRRRLPSWGTCRRPVGRVHRRGKDEAVGT